MEDEGFSPWFNPDGELLAIGEQYTRKEYARALQILAEGGSMYEGELAEGIVKAVQDGGGLMTLDDLRSESSMGRADQITLWSGENLSTRNLGITRFGRSLHRPRGLSG